MPSSVRIADRFDVIRPLGQGAFAHTLLAKDTALNRMVALKVLHPRAAQDWKTYELFEREAAVLKELRHSGIPMIHEAFRAPYDGADAAFLAMEYIEGTSASQIVADRRHLEQDEILNLFVELLGVLDYLHSRVPPVLHRDIKPANILVRPNGTPALVDFGAVRNVFRAADDGGSTVVGTYGYMPYEQYMGQASPASDLYALAATFLHLITGRAPPEFMTPAGRLEVPRELSTGEPLRGVMERMLQPAAADRFQSAREARGALMGAAPGNRDPPRRAHRPTTTGGANRPGAAAAPAHRRRQAIAQEIGVQHLADPEQRQRSGLEPRLVGHGHAALLLDRHRRRVAGGVRQPPFRAKAPREAVRHPRAAGDRARARGGDREDRIRRQAGTSAVRVRSGRAASRGDGPDSAGGRGALGAGS